MRNEVSQSFWQSAPILGVNAPGNCEGESVGAEFPVIFLFLSSVSGALPLEYLGILSKVCNFIESAPLTGQQVCTQIITKPDSSSSKLSPYTPSPHFFLDSMEVSDTGDPRRIYNHNRHLTLPSVCQLLFTVGHNWHSAALWAKFLHNFLRNVKHVPKTLEGRRRLQELRKRLRKEIIKFRPYVGYGLWVKTRIRASQDCRDY